MKRKKRVRRVNDSHGCGQVINQDSLFLGKCLGSADDTQVQWSVGDTTAGAVSFKWNFDMCVRGSAKKRDFQVISIQIKAHADIMLIERWSHDEIYTCTKCK